MKKLWIGSPAVITETTGKWITQKILLANSELPMSFTGSRKGLNIATTYSLMFQRRK